MLGDYCLEERLSRGGIAAVYYGYRNGQPDYKVAVKVFHAKYAQQPAFRAHLRAQVEMIGRFEHAHILPMLEYGEGEGLLYVVTPYMHAGTLEDLLLRVGGRFSALQTLPIMQQLCDAVQYAHDHRAIHGNIKPTNVLLSEQGGMLLADFGVAGDYAEGQQSLTQIGWGAAEYTAPEQSLGVLRPESDIYALGALLFTLVTGVPPFTGQTPVEVLLKHVRQPAPLARELVPSISSAVDDVLQRALRKRADERFASATEMRDALVQAVAIAPIASPLTGPLFPRTPLPPSAPSVGTIVPHIPLPLTPVAAASSNPASQPLSAPRRPYTLHNPQTPIPLASASASATSTPVAANNRSFKPIALRHMDEAVRSDTSDAESKEQEDETMVHNWDFLLDEKNESDEALFWSADPAEWSPIGDISAVKERNEPLTATEYLQRKPLRPDEDEFGQAKNYQGSAGTAKTPQTTQTANDLLRKWLPFIIVALLLLGLLGALCSAIL
ncbi:MAG: hypothetical protein NVS2B12_38460 [Ktedonobacteraceae bacterium]